MTLGNIPSVVVLAIVAVVEFALGVALTVIAAENGGNPAPASVNGIHVCAISPESRTLMAATSIASLVYGTWVSLHRVALTSLLMCVNQTSSPLF